MATLEEIRNLKPQPVSVVRIDPPYPVFEPDEDGNMVNTAYSLKCRIGDSKPRRLLDIHGSGPGTEEAAKVVRAALERHYSNPRVPLPEWRDMEEAVESFLADKPLDI